MQLTRTPNAKLNETYREICKSVDNETDKWVGTELVPGARLQVSKVSETVT